MAEPSSKEDSVEAMKLSQKAEEVLTKEKQTDSTVRYPASHFPATPRSRSGTPNSVSHTPLNDPLPLPTPPYIGPTRPVTPPLPVCSPTLSHTSDQSMHPQSGGAGYSGRIHQNQTTAPNRSLDNALNVTAVHAPSGSSRISDAPLNLSPTQSQSKRLSTRRIVTPAMTTDPLPLIPQFSTQASVDFNYDGLMPQSPRRPTSSGTFESTRQLHEALGLGGTRSGTQIEVEAQETIPGSLGGLMESFFANEEQGGSEQLPSVLERPEEVLNPHSVITKLDNVPGPGDWQQTNPVLAYESARAGPSGSMSTGEPSRTAQAVNISADNRPVWSGIYPVPSQIPVRPETPSRYLKTSQTTYATETSPNYWHAQQTTPYASSSSSVAVPPIPVMAPGSTYMLMAAQMASQRYQSNVVLPNQPIYTFPVTSGDYSIPVQFMNTQEPSYQTYTSLNVQARGINPREPHIPAPAQPTPLVKIATPTGSRQPQPDSNTFSAGEDTSAQVVLEPHEAALFSQLHGMDTPAEAPEPTLATAASAWKQCGDGILKEYSMMKQYHLAMRDLMRRSSEVFYQALSDWMLGLPPHIRLKDVFQAETTRRDPISGMISTVPFLSTPFTVILEQYRLLDSKIVEHLERKDTSLDEFEIELKNRLQTGLNRLINTEAGAVTTTSDIEAGAENRALHDHQADQASPEPYERQPMTTVEIQGQDNVRRHLQSVGGVHVYIDANGRVNTLRSNPAQEIIRENVITRKPQPTPYRSDDIHSTSFPQGNIRSVEMNTALQGMPIWLTNPMHPTGESQESIASTTTSTLQAAQQTYAAPQDYQGMNVNAVPQNIATYQYPTHPTVESQDTASGSVTTQAKTKMSKSVKRKGGLVEGSDPVKKTRKKQPSYH